jgi:predicted DNA-binding protein (MmcQ/YjbR family)
MDLEAIRSYCLGLPHSTEGIKWEHDLCFMLEKKMYCVTGLDGPFSCSFKCSNEDFAQLLEKPHIIPAPYMARNKWVNVKESSALSVEDWKYYIKRSYELIRDTLPKKIQQKLLDS